MFEIKINILDADVLQAFANLFDELTVVAKDRPALVRLPGPEMTAAEFLSKHTNIGHADNPATGADTTAHVTKDAATVFDVHHTAHTLTTPPAPSAAVVFAEKVATLPKPPAHSIAVAPPPPNAQTAQQATSAEPSEPDAAAVFGTGPSVAAASPAAPAAPGSASGAAVMLDVTGLPWDGRIHASTKTQTQDGTWKKKKGTGDVYFNEVVAQLRAAMGAPAPAATPVIAAVPQPPAPSGPILQMTSLAQFPHADYIKEGWTDEQLIGAGMAEYVTPGAPASPVPDTFPALMAWITSKGAALPAATVQGVCQKHGLAGMALVAVRKDLIQPIYNDLIALVGA